MYHISRRRIVRERVPLAYHGMAGWVPLPFLEQGYLLSRRQSKGGSTAEV